MGTIGIVSALYVKNYIVKIKFSTGEVKDIDFAIFIKKYAIRSNAKYYHIKYFKQFKIENSNIVWGDDWDLIHPPDKIYNNEF